MPTYRGICISLQSQYDALCLPEYPTSSAPATTSSREDSFAGELSTFSASASSSSPCTAEVFVPIYPGSLFWITYLCPNPSTANNPDQSNPAYYYFKLFLHGECLASWGSGAEDRWAGKVSHVIVKSGNAFTGEAGPLTKHALFFSIDALETAQTHQLEIRVFRSKARKREGLKHDMIATMPQDQGGICLKPAGSMEKSAPKRRYVYALLDPVDRPFAVFKYFFKSEEQLEALGCILPSKYGWSDTSSQPTVVLPRSQAPPLPRADSISSKRLPAIHGHHTAMRETHQEGFPVTQSMVAQTPDETLRRMDGLHVACAEGGRKIRNGPLPYSKHRSITPALLAAWKTKLKHKDTEQGQHAQISRAYDSHS